MDLSSFFNTRLAPILGFLLGRVLSRNQTYKLADWVADRVVARTNAAMVKAVRSNQAIVRDLPHDSLELDGAVREIFRNTARGYADWYRATAGGPEAVLASITIDPVLVDSLQRTQLEGRGLMIVGAHMSSFNVLLLALGVLGYPIQALSLSQLRGDMLVDNAVRRKFGLHITPISVQSLREAMERLRNGGIVMTGVDRPGSGSEELTFFGRKTRLPIGHARLAIQTNSRVLVGSTVTVRSGEYRADVKPLIDPEISGDLRVDSVRLAQQVLNNLEGFIRSRPGEWLMFYPVWPNEMQTDHRAKDAKNQE